MSDYQTVLKIQDTIHNLTANTISKDLPNHLLDTW